MQPIEAVGNLNEITNGLIEDLGKETYDKSLKEYTALFEKDAKFRQAAIGLIETLVECLTHPEFEEEKDYAQKFIGDDLEGFRILLNTLKEYDSVLNQTNKNNFSPIKEGVPALLTDRTFRTIRQGGATNALTKIRAIIDKTAKVDPISKTATISKGNFTLTIPNYDKLSGLKTSTYQLLDAITIAFTESGAKSPTVAIPLTAYMSLRGLKDRKEAKNQVKADLEVLRQASITGEEKRGKNTTAYSFVNIADSGEVKRNGDIVFTFGTTFYNMLLSYPIMNYPAQLQTLNSNRNPNSYYLLRKIAEHKNMNVGKQNEDTIAVKTLLSVAPFIPSYDEIRAINRNITERIIAPFERDMDALSDTLKWNYCHSNNEPLTDYELDTMTYDIFKDLLIRVEWNNYPDQTARLERKAERLEQSKKTRKRSPAKKKADTE